MQNPRIIPEPREISWSRGRFRLSAGHVILHGPRGAKAAKLLQTEILRVSGRELPVESSPGLKNVLIHLSRPSGGRLAARTGLGREGYVLRLRTDCLEIASAGEAGLYYGAWSFVQYLENHEQMRCLTIVDRPDLRMRGFHLDLKGIMPKFDYILRLVRGLARYRINTLLIEYEDKFPYRGHETFVSPDALSMQQIKKLRQVAQDNCIEIIPLVQCLGHMEYILKHRQYAGYREADSITQLCPLTPKCFDLFRDMADQVMRAHPESRYFHVGADETRSLGECPKCRRQAARVGKIGLYADYVKRVCRYVMKTDRTPILWDDMLTRHDPKHISLLPRGTILMYWLYHAREDAVPYAITEAGFLYSRKWMQKQYDAGYRSRFEQWPWVGSNILEDLPPEKLAMHEKYLKIPEYPMLMDAHPFTRMIREKGYQVIGASAVRMSALDSLISDAERASQNCRAWARNMVRHKGVGLVATAWARNNSLGRPAAHIDACWYQIAACGEACWRAVDMVSEQRFDEKFSLDMTGIRTSDLVDALYLLPLAHDGNLVGRAIRKLETVLEHATRNRDYVNLLLVSAKLYQHRMNWRLFIRQRIEPTFYRLKNRELTEPQRREIQARLRSFARSRTGLAREMRRALSPITPVREVREWLESFFTFEDEERGMLRRLYGKKS